MAKNIDNNGIIIKNVKEQENYFLKSKMLQFSLVTEKDAAFILTLRQNRGQHLSDTGDLQSQIKFISRYKEYEKAGKELYFIISDKSSNVGVIRLYKVNYEAGTFEWGSWILKKGCSPLYAIVSSLMIYNIAFSHLGLKLGIFEVRNDNDKTISFHIKTGANLKRKDQLNHYFEFNRTAFDKFHSKYQKYLGNIIYTNDI